jgi:hypothetical protein
MLHSSSCVWENMLLALFVERGFSLFIDQVPATATLDVQRVFHHP